MRFGRGSHTRWKKGAARWSKTLAYGVSDHQMRKRWQAIQRRLFARRPPCPGPAQPRAYAIDAEMLSSQTSGLAR